MRVKSRQVPGSIPAGKDAGRFKGLRWTNKSTGFGDLVYFKRMSDQLVVNEIYLNLQGESTFAGLPCVFIRLTACDLRCSYCDTAYAFTEGKKKTLTEILAEVKHLAKPFSNPQSAIRNPQLPLVELTGGEPLLQKDSQPLMQALCDAGFTGTGCTTNISTKCHHK